MHVSVSPRAGRQATTAVADDAPGETVADLGALTLCQLLTRRPPAFACIDDADGRHPTHESRDACDPIRILFSWVNCCTFTAVADPPRIVRVDRPVDAGGLVVRSVELSDGSARLE